MKNLILIALCIYTGSAFAYTSNYNPYKPYSPLNSTHLENQLRDIESSNQKHQITRGEITKDQFGNGYTYRDSSGHGSHVYHDSTFGGHTYVDSW